MAEAGHAGFEEGRAGLAHGQLDGGGGALALLADAEDLADVGGAEPIGLRSSPGSRRKDVLIISIFSCNPLSAHVTPYVKQNSATTNARLVGTQMPSPLERRS